jgi:CO dehydrogenase nickel-insertion accessory protein CooC1
MGVIAIAGVKGGCGKTVTTLGLSEAFARTGTQSIAVDTNKQLPDLHRLAGVDRTPTLDQLVREADLTEVLQRNPRQEDAYVLSSPETTVNFENLKPSLDRDQVTVLLDCPPGIGPDAVAPLSISDRVVVVTTDRPDSIATAKQTIELCRRLKVPVAGVILNKCESVRSAVAEEFEVPIVGAVPGRASPLTDLDVRQAYETAVTQLNASEGRPSEDTKHLPRERLLSTGIEPLDRIRDGGFPPGTVVGIVTEEKTPAEALLYRLTAVRNTLYLTTERTESAVKNGLEALSLEKVDPVIERLGSDPELSDATELIERLPEGATLVVDAISPLEATDSETYLNFLNTLVKAVRESGSLAFVHLPGGSDEQTNRSMTKRLVDTILVLEAGGAPAEVCTLRVPSSRIKDQAEETARLEFEPDLVE